MVEVIGEEDVNGTIWYQVQYNGVVGYIRNDLISIIEQPKEASETPDVSA